MNNDSISGDPKDVMRMIDSLSRSSAAPGKQKYSTVQNCNGNSYAIDILFCPEDESTYGFLELTQIASASLDNAFLDLKDRYSERFDRQVVEEVVVTKLSECWHESPHRNKLMDFVVVVSDPADN